MNKVWFQHKIKYLRYLIHKYEPTLITLILDLSIKIYNELL
jgi:hypothetical protein